MRPLTLTIEGLRSFRTPETIEFGDRTHLAIIGDTGAGKSSILEAITFALYGHTTWAKHANQYLVSDTAQQLRVELVFHVAGETYRVQRAIRRDGAGQPRPASVKLERLGADGEPVERVDQATAVNARIQDLIGLDWDAFIRTVVLPQGQFARLLVADAPTERAKILRQVWRADELAAAGRQADEALAELGEPAGRLGQARAVFPTDAEAELGRLQWAARRAGEEAERRQAALTTAYEATETLTAARAALAGLAEARAALSVIDLAGTVGAARALVDLDQQLRRRRDELQRETDALRTRRDAIPADDGDGPDAGATGAAESVIRRLPNDLDTLLRDGADAAEQRAAIDRSAATAERLRAADASARARLAERSAAREPLAEAHETAVSALAAAQELVTRAHDLAVVAQRERAEWEAAQATAETAQAAAGEAHAAASHHAAALREARRADAAAAAAHGLHPGDDCPVCRQRLDDDWIAPAAEQLAAVEQAAEAADVAARAATARAEGALAVAGNLERRSTDAAGLAARARAEAAMVLGPAYTDDADPLAGLSEQAQGLQGDLDAFDRATEELRAAAMDARAAAAAADERARAAADAAAAATRKVQDLLDDLRGSIAQLPERFRPDVTLPRAATGVPWLLDLSPLQAVSEAIQARRRLLESRGAERAALGRQLDALHGQARQLQQRHEHEVEGPRRTLCATLDEHRERIGGLRLAVTLPDRAASTPLGRIADVATGLAEALRESGTRLLARLTTEQQREREAIAGLARVGADAGLDRLEQAHREAEYRARQTAEQAAHLEDSLPHIVRLDSLGARVAGLRAALGDLSAALKPGAFPKWLTLRRSKALLAVASTLLGEITRGRYAFADIDAEDADWLIYDCDSGQARSPSTLSGGEKFIASLALALGMVELMARSGGRLESLFLDEGFGALDRTNLDAAIEALAGVASRGRMVAVISHVQAVAEQVDHVLAVTRHPTGSRTQWLTPGQRREAVAAELLDDAEVALHGLVD